MGSNTPSDAQRNQDLHADAATLPLEEMIARVDAAQARLASAAMALSDNEFRRARTRSGVSALATLQSFVEMDTRIAQQVLYVALSGELPAEEPVSLPDERDALLADSKAAIESLWVHVREADPDGFLDTTWRHPAYGELTWRGWLLSLEVLADDHAKRLEEMPHA